MNLPALGAIPYDVAARLADENTPWTDVVFGTGWEAAAAYKDYGPTRYRKIGNRVQVVMNAKYAGGGSTLVFNLPAGYRPRNGFHAVAVWVDNGAVFRELTVHGNDANPFYFAGDVRVSSPSSSYAHRAIFEFECSFGDDT